MTVYLLNYKLLKLTVDISSRKNLFLESNSKIDLGSLGHEKNDQLGMHDTYSHHIKQSFQLKKIMKLV